MRDAPARGRTENPAVRAGVAGKNWPEEKKLAFRFSDLFNNSSIVINPYGLVSRKVKNGLVIAHVSDLHEKVFGADNEELFAAVREIRPDIIAITGDLVQHENQAAADIRYTENVGAGLSAIAPSYFVTGNHEQHFADAICGALERTGVTIIDGYIESLDIRGTVVNISGVQDPAISELDINAAAAVFDGVEGYNIFLTHRPEIFGKLTEGNIDLVLAGHTHAGQIRLPGISSIYMMGQGFFPKLMEGEFEVNGTTMIISRGLGSSGYPTVRFNNPPDLVAVAVMSPEEAQETG